MFPQNTGQIPALQNPTPQQVIQVGQELLNIYHTHGQYMTPQQQQHYFHQFLPFLKNAMGRPPFHTPPQMGVFMPPQQTPGGSQHVTPSISIPNSIPSITPGQSQPTSNPSVFTIPEHLRPLHNHRTHYAIKPFMVKHECFKTDAAFHISSDEYRRINLSKDLIANKDFLPITLILNSWKAKTDESKCEWPENASLLINNRELPLQRRRKMENGTDRPVFVGKDAPFNISEWLVEGKNVLSVKQNACSCNYNFAIGVYLCQSQNMIMNALKDVTNDISSGEQLIDKLLENGDAQNEDDDIEILQKTVILNLKCPISLTIIKTPTKGVYCRHPACFDLASYLAMNTGLVPLWKCPICNNPTPPPSLRRDMFFQNLLTLVPKGAYEVVISGSHSSWKVTKIDNSDDSDGFEDDDDGETKESISKLNTIDPRNIIDNSMTTSSGGGNVISLISDDEDDGDVDQHNGNKGDDDDNDDDDHRQKRHRVDAPTAPVDTTSPSNTNVTLTAPSSNTISSASATVTTPPSNTGTETTHLSDSTTSNIESSSNPTTTSNNDTGVQPTSDIPLHWLQTIQALTQQRHSRPSN